MELAGVARSSVEPDRYTTCTGRLVQWGGVPAASPMPKFLSYEKERDQLLVVFVNAHLSSVELLGIYHV